MLAESNTFILLLLGALIVIGGLLLGYTMTRPKTASRNARAGDAHETAREDHAQSATSDELPTDQTTTSQSSVDESTDDGPQPTLDSEPSDELDDSPTLELDGALQQLDSQIKHRIVYRFMPHLKGMLFEGETLDGYLADAAIRAMQRGWNTEKLADAAQTGKWKRPRNEQASPEA